MSRAHVNIPADGFIRRAHPRDLDWQSYPEFNHRDPRCQHAIGPWSQAQHPADPNRWIPSWGDEGPISVGDPSCSCRPLAQLNAPPSGQMALL